MTASVRFPLCINYSGNKADLADYEIIYLNVLYQVLRDASPCLATNSEECNVVWRNRYFCFLARLVSILLKSWCIMIEQGDTTRPAVNSSEPLEAVME